MAAEPRPDPVLLDVIPRVSIAIDGRPAEVPLAGYPGEHLIEAEGSGWYWVALPAAPDTLVLPAAFPPEAIGWVADEVRREALSALLAATLGEGIRATVVADGRVWTGTTGRSDWTVRDRPGGPPVAVRRPRPLAPALLVVAGSASTAIGAIVSAQAWTVGASEASSLSWVDRERARRRYWAGHAATGSGIALAGAGLIWVGAR